MAVKQVEAARIAFMKIASKKDLLTRFLIPIYTTNIQLNTMYIDYLLFQCFIFNPQSDT